VATIPADPLRRHKFEAKPVLGQRAKEIQPYGTLARYPLSLSDSARTQSGRSPESVARRYHVLARHVQEAPLAGLRAHFYSCTYS